MSKLTIVTNNKPRSLVYGYQLSDKEKKDFDYLSPEELEFHDFVVYKGNVYDLSEFMVVVGSDNPLHGWDAYISDSFFSGIVVKMISSDTVIVGRYYS